MLSYTILYYTHILRFNKSKLSKTSKNAMNLEKKKCKSRKISLRNYLELITLIILIEFSAKRKKRRFIVAFFFFSLTESLHVQYSIFDVASSLLLSVNLTDLQYLP